MSLFGRLTASLSSPPRGTDPAAAAINALGLDLIRQCTSADSNALLSPYSVQSALVMAYAGADGITRAEMAKALHYPEDDTALHRSFAALQGALADMEKSTAEIAEGSRKWGGPSVPITLAVANRLFGQHDYDFRTSFLALLKDSYRAPFQPMDFTHESARARQSINEWVESQTRHRIRDLIPANRLDRHSRLVLVNAIYLKAPWQTEFYSGATRPLPFHVQGHEPHDVPTMFCQRDLGYVHSDGFTAVSIPYSGDDLHFLILLPDARNGLQALESGMKPAVLADCAELPEADVKLYLPKFKLEPPVVELAHLLGSLGMMTSFDHPTGSANFERMAPRRANDYLCLSAVFHKAFLALDEQGTEAAAATAVAAMAAGLLKRNAAPVEVRVNHPFLFAIQHRPSGACLFLGRMADPR